MKTDKQNSGTSTGITRRGLLKGTAAAVAAAVPGAAHAGIWRRRPGRAGTRLVATKGNIKHSVCDWCFVNDCSVKPMTLEQLACNASTMGIESVELVKPKDWHILKKYGLVCAMAGSHGFVKGFNDKANHQMCIDKIKQAVDDCAEAGFPSVITFSGFRNDIPDDVGLENTVEGLKKVIGYAERKQVNLCMEVLNSRVDVPMKGHPGYMGDTVEWVGEVCKRISSPRMTMLFDIYHIQIMQGDIITRIRKWHKYIGHYHTAGVPGRNELDDNQEINYPPIMRTIVETGFKGYVAHEFIPTRDPLAGLREAVRLCDV